MHSERAANNTSLEVKVSDKFNNSDSQCSILHGSPFCSIIPLCYTYSTKNVMQHCYSHGVESDES